MKRKMKRVVITCSSFLLCILMVLQLTACSKAESQTGSSASAENERIKLTFWTGLGNKVAEQLKTWDEIECWKEIENKFNVDFEFIHPPVGQETENFNLMIATNTLPDIINSGWRDFQGGGPNKAIKDGIILDLTSLMQEHAPNYMALLKENPEWKRQAVTDEGVYYNFPYIFQSRLANSFIGFQIRQDWLDKLNLKMPENIDDWYKVLTAFKNGDPNGNGKNDEIPFVPSKSHNSLRHFKMAFGLSEYFDGFFLDKDKKVQYSYLQPQYKDYLQTMKKWYAEGLIDPEYISIDNKVLTSKMTSDQVGATYAGYGMGFLGNWTSIMKNEKKDENFFLVGTPFPKAPDGNAYGFSDTFVTGSGAAISTSCKNQERAVEILDYLYSPEGHLLVNFGTPDKVYSMVDGKPEYKKDELLKQEPGLSIDSILVKYGMACQGGPFVQDEAYSRMVASTYLGQKIAAENYMKASIDWMIPPVTPTMSETSELSAIINDAKTLMEEYEAKVIMGIESIDKLPVMVDNLQKLKIQRAIDIKQQAVDRYYKR